MKKTILHKTQNNEHIYPDSVSIVFSTKDREPALSKDGRTELFKYIWGILKERRCHLYRINGVDDHLHIVSHIHPSVALSDLVKDIKVSSGKLIKTEGLFPRFKGWQDGYGAFTYSIREKDSLIAYVKNQEAHHAKVSFRQEYRALLEEHGIDFDEKYLL